MAGVVGDRSGSPSGSAEDAAQTVGGRSDVGPEAGNPANPSVDDVGDPSNY